MLRPRAIRELLLEQIAGLHRAGDQPAADGRRRLQRRRKRALVLVLVEWAAIVVLVLLRDAGQPFLTLGRSEQTVFALGILAVAVHSGFKLGQLERFSSVQRALDEVDRLDPAE